MVNVRSCGSLSTSGRGDSGTYIYMYNIAMHMLTKVLSLPLVLAFASVGCAMAQVRQSASSARSRVLSTIIIDPGHGGKDPGAIGRWHQEKDIVLNVSRRLGKLLKDSLPELKVVFTRDSDVFIPLDQRAKTAAANSADVFVSIHANSTRDKNIAGAETYLLGQHRSKDNLEVAQKENSVVTLEENYETKYEGFDPSQPESIITFAGLQSDYINKSIDLAVSLQKGFSSLGRADRGVRQAGFLVLRQVAMPSVLIELGFISNPAEEKYMASEQGAQQLAEAIFNSIRFFKSGYDGRKVVIRNSEEKPVKAKAPKVNLWPSGVNFRVQVAAAQKELAIDSLGASPVSRLTEDGVNKYMVGICKTLDEAQTLKDKMKAVYPGCFVVAFNGKEKISVRAARKLAR